MLLPLADGRVVGLQNRTVLLRSDVTIVVVNTAMPCCLNVACLLPILEVRNSKTFRPCMSQSNQSFTRLGWESKARKINLVEMRTGGLYGNRPFDLSQHPYYEAR
jgi:hypothetical protein